MLQLESQISSQEKQNQRLEQQLLQWKEENEQLNYKVSHIESKRDLLKQSVQELEEENRRLKDEIDDYDDASYDDSKNSSRLLVPVTYNPSRQRPPLSLFHELPDLQYDNSNYEFLAKIKGWLLKGEVDPLGVFRMVRLKCPQEAWQKITQNVKNKDLTETAFSDPATKGRQKLEKLWRCVSEALGPGTALFEHYYYRKQNGGESFEEYFQEKFRLYSSYGVDNTEPNKNDQHFLYIVIEKATKRYRVLLSHSPKSYTDLLNKARLIDCMITATAWKNKCLNCDLEGHTVAVCRRPGGDAEVGPNECYTCGKYGHHAKNCQTYRCRR